MKILKKIKAKIWYIFLRNIRPEIIGGYSKAKMKYPKNTGISNLTHISNYNNNLQIAEKVFIGHFNYIDAYNAKITIENNVQITNYVNILTHSSNNSIRMNNHSKIREEVYNELFNIGEVFIGEYSYIGPHSVIMPNTKIGRGCVISAYSYLKGDYPDYSIIRGIPAKVVGNTKSLDNQLLEKFPDLKESYYLKNEIN